jgi:hypothetical protein
MLLYVLWQYKPPAATGLRLEVVLNRRRGACIRGELATIGRALPERVKTCRVRTAYHQSVGHGGGKKNTASEHRVL